jgi:hypothetical protein
VALPGGRSRPSFVRRWKEHHPGGDLASDLTLIAQLPTRGVRTIYSRLGDWFAWLCILALAALIALAWRRDRGQVAA